MRGAPVMGYRECVKMKAENAEDFEAVWNEHLSHVSYLAHSLPSKEALEVLDLVKELKRYVKIASDKTYAKSG